jgi:hypothetical protein
MPTYFVSVDEKELERLREVDRFMDALESAGVDNWEGYDVAMRLFHGELQEGDI